MTSTIKRLSGSPTISVGGKQRTITNYGTPKITATLTPAMSTIYAGATVGDVTNWAAFNLSSNYSSPVGTIVSVVVAFLGDAASASDPLADGETAGFEVTVTDSEGTVAVFPADAIDITLEPPAIATAPTLPSGSPVRGEQLTGTAGTFSGGTGTVTHRWQVSDNGITDWTDTGTTGLTGPAMTAAKYYRLVSRSANSGATVDNPSAARGPVVTPTISLSGLTLGEAVEGDHASITMTASAGTITARKWGSTAGGSEYGTGTNPTDFTGGTTLHATATIGGFDYATFAPIEGVTSEITATVQPSMSQLAAGQAMQNVLNWSLFQNVNNYQSSGGTIVSAVVAYTGDAVDATTALAENDVVGFTITVTDSVATEKTFTAAQITVSSASAVIINSVAVGTYNGVDALPVSLNAENVENGNAVYGVMVPATDTAPIDTEVVAGQASGGGSPTASGNGTWPTSFDLNIPADVPRGLYRLYIVINNGQNSAVGVSNSFLADTTPATLSLPVVSLDGADIIWGVTSNDDVGTITGQLYLASATPTDEEVYAGTGAVDGSVYDQPTADENNGGTFTAPDAGSYKVRIFATDDFGTKSPIVVSDTIVAGGSTINLIPIGVIRSSSATNSTSFGEVVNASIIDTDPVPGRELVITCSYAESAGGTGVAVTVDGNPATVKNVQNPAIQANTGVWTYDVSAGGNFAVEIATSTAWRSYEVMMYFADGHSSITGYGASNTSYAEMDVSAVVTNGSEIVGVCAMSNFNTTGDVALVGLTDVGGSQGLNTVKKNTFLRATSDANETREMLVTPNGNGSGNVATSIVVIS